MSSASSRLPRIAYAVRYTSGACSRKMREKSGAVRLALSSCTVVGDICSSTYKRRLAVLLPKARYYPVCKRALQEVDHMWTKIVGVCALLCLAYLAVAADGSEEKLYSAIRTNNLQQIKALLDQGVTANIAASDGIT